ncbi:MAG: PKD repeat protein, partial [Planctomycetota bacterium]
MNSSRTAIYRFETCSALGAIWMKLIWSRAVRCLAVFCLLASGATAQIGVDFTATPQSGTQPLMVSFEGTVTGGTPFLWLWDFGDGNGDSGMNVVHNYSVAQTTSFTVSLSVFTGVGSAVEVKTDFITVFPAAITVDFSASVVAGVNPLTVSFMNLTDVSPLTSSHWDFGDGQTSN